MEKNTKLLLIILAIILAWAILSGNIDLGLFSATPTPSTPMISGSGGVAI